MVRRTLCLGVVLFLGVLETVAQIVAGTGPAELFLNVSVRTKRGEWVSGLAAPDFQVFEGKTSQSITSFSRNDGPATVGLMVDVSGSSRKFLEELREALAAFVRGCNGRTQFFLMTFDENQKLVLDFTESKADVLNQIDDLAATKPGGYTNFFDAVNVGLDKISEGGHAKKALVVFTDAGDNNSRTEFGKIKKRLQSSDVTFYCYFLQDQITKHLETIGKRDMSELTRISGGMLLTPRTAADVPRSGFLIAEDIRNQYRVGFRPLSIGREKEWREFEVKVQLPPLLANGGKVDVRTRTGFLPTSSGK